MSESTRRPIATTTAAECPDFWAGMAPGEHFVHLYEGEQGLLDLLHAFTVDGLRQGEAAIVVATPPHLAALDRRLTADGFDVTAARWQGQYLPLDAKATLAQFMISGWPDDEQFERVMSNVLVRARRNGRRVRAFGEMVALLWADGRADATVRLEHLWNEFCQSQALPLFCAYPMAAFAEGAADRLTDICKAHSRLIAA